MCFPRKPGLGRYNGTRAEWYQAYRAARLLPDQAQGQSPTVDPLAWKAALIVGFERDDEVDWLLMPVGARLASKRIIDEIVAEAA